jgi:hypothetical protein
MNIPEPSIGAKLLKALENGLLIAYRVKNDKLDYSLMNRPEPTLSGVDDHALATAIVHAGNAFKLVVDKETGGGRVAEKVSRSDGRTVSYNEFIDIDWAAGTIRTTRRGTMTFTALQGIVGDLIRTAKAPTPAAVRAPN